MKKNILVVDDSALMRRVLCDIIDASDNYVVADVCKDGQEAFDKLSTKKYDGVLLDVNMPRLNGLELLDKLRASRIDATVIMVSTETTENAVTTMKALEKGAIDFVAKPTNIIEAKGTAFRDDVTRVLDAVVQSRRQVTAAATQAESKVTPVKKPADAQIRRLPPVTGKANRLIALACSTGGPKALQSVIPFLDPKIDAPMVLVQHMPVGFTKSMADRLNEISKVNVKEAENGEVLQKGWVYIAPGGKHMEVKKSPAGAHTIYLHDAPPIGGLRPCADVMYKSLVNCGYDEITCVVLTGMGADGTEGIKALSARKPVHVIAQNAATCVVYGMPKAIAESGLVDEVVPLTSVADTIKKNVGVH
ncbi:MAG: chemotaxis-specific protein-glutamate methyltransferase CheB [Lachnospiraceae bacterium]|nr:chemotaxis-specific protein-glutamate methyltransferase CheB [Lachnospiraceae bacterium]